MTTEDEDRFAVRLNRAVEYLRVASRQQQFEDQFDLLLKRLDRWVRGEPRVARSFLTLRDEALLFVAVMDRLQCDPDFEDRLSALDLEIHADPDLDLIRMNTVAMPGVSRPVLDDGFLDPGFTLEHAGSPSEG